MELDHNKHDIFIYIICALLIGAILIISNIVTNKANGDLLYAVVTIDGKVKYKLDMNEDKELILEKDKYSTLLGDMIIEIKDKQVRVKQEESPLHYCSLQGYVSSVGKPIVCLPNSVIVVIEGQDVPENDFNLGN